MDKHETFSGDCRFEFVYALSALYFIYLNSAYFTAFTI